MRRVSTRGAILAALVTSVLCAATASAQVVSGTVLSKGHPVVGAAVRILELDRVEQSGALGRFTFSNVPRGSYQVFASAAGYASAAKTIQVTGDSASVSFDLAPSAILLQEVVVSGSPWARLAGQEYQPTASLSETQLLSGAGTSLADKLSDLPGVAVRGNGAAPARPILRGLGDNEVLVLENGLRDGDVATYDPAHATPIAALGVSHVDVVRGPAAILYGPNTLGGLVNVITNTVPTPSDHAISGTVSTEGNTVSDEYAGYFNTVFTRGHQAFSVSAGGQHTNDVHIPEGTYTDPGTGAAFTLDQMPQTFAHAEQAGAGYAYQGDFGRVGIGGKYFGMNYGVPGVPPNPDWMTVPPTTSRIAQQRYTVEFRSVLNTAGSFARRVRLDANYNDYNHSEFPTVQDSRGVSDPQANHFHKRELNAVLQVQHQPLGNLHGTLGLWADVADLTIGGDQPLGPNSVTTGLAGYAYEEYLAGADTHLQAGLRFDYNKIQTHPYAQSSDSVFRTLNTSRLSNAVTASLGAIQRLVPGLTASFSVARSFRAPTVQELFANGLDAASATYSIGTATLGPETGLGLDASLKGRFNNVVFEVSPYANFISHYIYPFLRGDTIQGFPVRQFGATDARLMGYEASVTVQPVPGIALAASSDYVNAEDTQHNVPLPFIPPLRGLLRGTYENGTYMGMVEWRLAARQTRLGEGDTPTPGYAVANIGFRVRIPAGNVVQKISIHVDNVFNTVYRDNLSVIKDFLPQPGRAFRLDYELTY